MRFKIRKPFAVHHERVLDRDEGDGRIKKDPVVESHYANEEIDLNEKDARKHLHALEPVCKDARAFMERVYEDNKRIAEARATSNATGTPFPGLAEAIAAGVAQALVQLGVKPIAAR